MDSSAVRSGIHNGKFFLCDLREWFDFDTARDFLSRDRFARRVDGTIVRYQQGDPVTASQFRGRYVIIQDGIVLWSF